MSYDKAGVVTDLLSVPFPTCLAGGFQLLQGVRGLGLFSKEKNPWCWWGGWGRG